MLLFFFSKNVSPCQRYYQSINCDNSMRLINVKSVEIYFHTKKKKKEKESTSTTLYVCIYINHYNKWNEN